MAVSDYLQNLQNEGVEAGYFLLQPLGAIDKSCCKRAGTEVIDFDAVKGKITKGQRTNTPKSCDALKILPALERIDFIEMKGFREMLTRSRGDAVQLNQQVQGKIAGFNLLDKIVDSLQILDMLVMPQSFGLAFNDDALLYYQNTQKHLVVLIDIDPAENAIEYLALNFLFLGEFSTSVEYQIEHHFATELDRFPLDLAPNFQQPVLKNCNQIDAYYASL